MSMQDQATNTGENLGTGPGAPSAPKHRYTAAKADEIELAWQKKWLSENTFRQPNPGEPGFDASRPKFYCLDMFPYPSGAGLHVGHPEGYTATDIVCRYKRMRGFNVLHPMGWDAFGLPAEQYAIQTGVHPAVTTKKSINTFRAQLQRFGFSYDWSREFGTIDPEYYKWTQWIFLKLYDAWMDGRASKGTSEQASEGKSLGRARPIGELVKLLESGEIPPQVNPASDDEEITPAPQSWNSCTREQKRAIINSYRLAYLGETTVNWCPKLGTVLANDEVIDGRSERGGYPVLRKPMKQWMFRITAYAERLLTQLDPLDWPESTKVMQREWIGKSEGAEVDFKIDCGGHKDGTDAPSIRVFTTRPDTIFGATYMVLAPEHEIVDVILKAPADRTDLAKLRAYVTAARNRSDVERMENKEKTGVDLGIDAINPATGEKIPVYVADYVLPGYGTGAIMAVPAHDQRDFDFAQAFNLPIKDVIYPRTVMAMKYFADNALSHETTDERWAGVLADFLGWTTSTNAEESDFPECLRIVRERRASSPNGTIVVFDVANPAMGRAGEVGKRRGVQAIVWFDALESLKIDSFAELKQRFTSRTYHARSGGAYEGQGTLVHSKNNHISINGLPVPEAKRTITQWLSSQHRGSFKTNFKLRDWTFSRQRYWGEPFPIVFDDAGNHYAVGEKTLPVRLPDLEDYAPIESDDPQPLLAKAKTWARTTAGEAGVDPALLDPKAPVTRECNTMPGSAGSSWYFSRYCDAHNAQRYVSREADAYWMGGQSGSNSGTKLGGVDLYLGGSEHAVGHLFYSRFWQNVLFDLGEASVKEPFHKLFHQGLITSFAYQRADKTLVPSDTVQEIVEGDNVRYVEKSTGERLTQTIAKMSKSLKNVVNPDDIIKEYGADTFRVYEMYMGPLEASKPWNTKDIVGPFRFLQRVWRNVLNEETGAVVVTDAPVSADLEKKLHRTIADVTNGIETLSLHTAIAKMIELNNELTKGTGGVPRKAIETLVVLLSPFAPHLAEELWQRLGHTGGISRVPWPTFDPAKLVDAEVEIPVSVLGKVRSRIMVPTGADAKTTEAKALADPKIAELIAGKAIKKVIVVPGKMVNIVHA